MDYKITYYNYITSSIGNAYFSGVSFDQLWNCVVISSSREELDAAVLATIRINDLTKEKNND
jgi:hypothetical protein